MLDYFGYTLGILILIWFFYDDFFDFLMLKYSAYTRVPISKEYKIEKVNLFKNNELIKSYNILNPYNSYKRNYPDISHIEIVYTFLGKRYRIIYNKEFDFPPYPKDIKLPIGYKFEFLSCTLSDDEDITLKMNELLGPMRNFYKDLGIEIPVSFLTTGRIECLDNNLNGFILDDKLEIK